MRLRRILYVQYTLYVYLSTGTLYVTYSHQRWTSDCNSLSCFTFGRISSHLFAGMDPRREDKLCLGDKKLTLTVVSHCNVLCYMYVPQPTKVAVDYFIFWIAYIYQDYTQLRKGAVSSFYVQYDIYTPKCTDVGKVSVHPE